DANYPGGAALMRGGATLDPAPLSDDLVGFLVARDGDQRSRLRDLVLEAVGGYGFLDGRNHTARNGWIVSGCAPHLRHELRRRGGTALEGYDTWRAFDTQSYHALRSNRWIGCYFREYPMGWADVAGGHEASGTTLEHVRNPPANFSQQDFWRWVQANTNWNIFSGRDNPLANSHAIAEATQWRGRGMPGYIDIGASTHGEGQVRFAVRVSRLQEVLGVPGAGSEVKQPTGIFRLFEQLPGGVMSVVSAAETYFERPVARDDGKHELASLFNPYWQARLSPLRDGERVQARLRQGVL